VHSVSDKALLRSSGSGSEQSKTPLANHEGSSAVAIQSLHDYESSKFELAEVLRAIKSRVPKAEVDLDNHVTTLFTRLPKIALNLVVVGRFSRGKSIS